MYLLGGEAGFLCDPEPCELPYFNDVWCSSDGAEWELVTESAGWSPRLGHQCAVSFEHIVCWGGFGLPKNPMDVWVSPNGADWEQVSDSPWNAERSDDVTEKLLRRRDESDAILTPSSGQASRYEARYGQQRTPPRGTSIR